MTDRLQILPFPDVEGAVEAGVEASAHAPITGSSEAAQGINHKGGLFVVRHQIGVAEGPVLVVIEAWCEGHEANLCLARERNRMADAVSCALVELIETIPANVLNLFGDQVLKIGAVGETDLIVPFASADLAAEPFRNGQIGTVSVQGDGGEQELNVAGG